ncbi:MAG: hypothetical protein HGB12_14320, partial [Bacteroidetes bacterium]|nr:hypothetical protein [Bacteroidota bacterium]
DFVLNNVNVSGYIELNKNFTPDFIQEKSDKKEKKTKVLKCPKCGKGEMLKGNSAYGCSRFREDCKFVIPFEALQEKFNSTELTAAKLKKMISI